MQLGERLHHREPEPRTFEAARETAIDLGFTVAEVVQDYSGISQTTTELSAEQAAPMTTDEVQTLISCVTAAIAGAVTEHGGLRETQSAERLGRLAHDLRNHLNSALLSFG